jgi:hypothetical protein
MALKTKLDLSNLTDQEILDLARLVTDSMNGNATFPAPNPPLTDLAAQREDINTLIGQRADLLQQAQTLTIQIRDARNRLEAALNAEAGYVEDTVKNMGDEQAAAAITSAGMTVAASTGGAVGPMPKVEGLTATQGDADGEIDLAWNRIPRGLQNYIIEITEDATGLAGWKFAQNSRKSSATVKNLTSGKRYWFRVTAEGAEGPGPASDPVTKVAP